MCNLNKCSVHFHFHHIAQTLNPLNFVINKRDYQYTGCIVAKIVVHTVQLYTRYCRFAASAAAATHTARTK